MSLLTLSITTLGFSAWLLPGSLEGFNQNITIEVGNIKDLTYLEIVSAEPFTFTDNSFVEEYDANTGLGKRVKVGNISLKMNIDYSKIKVSQNRSKIIIDLNYKFKQYISAFDFSSFAAKDDRGNYFSFNNNVNYGVTSTPLRNKISYTILLDSSITTIAEYNILLPFVFPKDFAKSLLDISFFIEPRAEGLI